jgi:hypothetical protein
MSSSPSTEDCEVGACEWSVEVAFLPVEARPKTPCPRVPSDVPCIADQSAGDAGQAWNGQRGLMR